MTDVEPKSALQRLAELERGGQPGRQAASPGGGRSAGRPAAGGVVVGGSAPRRRVGLGGAIAVVALMLWKFKAVLLIGLSKFKFILAGLKLVKFGNLLTTSSTMLLSMWAYSMFFGAPFAIGFVLLILVHELGHGIAAKAIGLPVGAPIFIPFFGAVIALKARPRTGFQDFVIGAGGPLAGTLGGLLCLGLAQTVAEDWAGLLTVLAFFTLMINLFNLIPVWQLDGARMSALFSGGMWGLAALVLAGGTFWLSGLTGELNPVALLMVLLAGYRALSAGWSWIRSRRAQEVVAGLSALRQLQEAERRKEKARDEDVTNTQRWIAWGTYVGLALGLVVCVHLLMQALPELPE